MSLTSGIRTSSWRSYCAWAVILALVFRGLVPLGYMPDFSKGGAGFFPVTICSGYDRATIFLDQDFNKADAARHGKGDSGHDDTTFCPFGVSSIFAWAGVSALVWLALAFSFIVVFHADFRLGRQRFFANTSSRSPPQFS
jgi:hypothetical protein